MLAATAKISMKIYTIQAKIFKELYYRSLTLGIIVIVMAFFIVNFGLSETVGFDPKRQWSMPILLGMFVLSLMFGWYNKSQMEKVLDWEDLEDQLIAYEKLYNFKLLFHLLSCLILGMMYVITKRSNFFYFALFELVMMLQMFPSSVLFKKAFRNDQVIVC
jgi:hypothetical protein